MAALVEGRHLDRIPAAMERLTTAATEADSAGLREAAAALHRMREGLATR